MVLCLFRAIQQHLFGPSRMPCVLESQVGSASVEERGICWTCCQSNPESSCKCPKVQQGGFRVQAVPLIGLLNCLEL